MKEKLETIEQFFSCIELAPQMLYMQGYDHSFLPEVGRGLSSVWFHGFMLYSTTLHLFACMLQSQHWRRSGVFIVRFEHFSHSFSSISIVSFEQVNVYWWTWYLISLLLAITKNETKKIISCSISQTVWWRGMISQSYSTI